MRKLIRFLCLTLCLTLLGSTALAVEYTMPEKMRRQIDSGSGLKGAVTLAVAGGSEWLDLLLPFTGANLQVRYITTDGQFQAQIYALDDQDQQRALTQAYGDAEHLYLRSALLPDTVLSMPLGSALMDTILGGEGSNPTIYSAVQALFSMPSEGWESEWLPALEPYENALELWLTDYAAQPSIHRTENGSSSMTLRYDIPADALKAAIKATMNQALKDHTLMTLLDAVLSPEQQAVYANPDLGYFYDAVIDALPLEGSLTLERTLSTLGDMLSTTLTMPLPDNDRDWSTLTYEFTPRESSLTLTGAFQTVTLVIRETASMSDRTVWNGALRYLPVEGTPIAASYSLSKQFSTSTDDDNRTHEQTQWQLRINPDLSHLAEDDPTRADYPDFEEISITLNAHYSSKSQYNDPTTLEATFSAELPSLTLDAAMTFKTSSPWVLSDLPTNATTDQILELTPERIEALLTSFARNAAITMTSLSDSPAEDEPDPAVTMVPPAN